MERRAGCRKIYFLKDESGIQQKWLISVFNRSGTNPVTLAEKLHISRQAVSTWMTGKSHLTYMAVCAICYVLKLPDNCEKLYSAIMSDQKK